MEQDIRHPAVAGTFYPEDPAELMAAIEGYLSAAAPCSIDGKLRGLVVPHAGYIYSGPIAAYGYKLLAKQKPADIAILGPSHYAAFPGACESGFRWWETPLGRVRAKSAAGGPISVFPAAHGPEHCLEVQLPFLQAVLGEKFGIWPLLCGEADPAELADALMERMEKGTFIIASSDLSHYKSYDAAKRIDAIANETIPGLDIARFGNDGDACGKAAILTLMHIAKKKKWKGRLLDYRNSGDTAGPRNQVVGYGCYAFYGR